MDVQRAAISLGERGLSVRNQVFNDAYITRDDKGKMVFQMLCALRSGKHFLQALLHHVLHPVYEG